MAAKKQKLYDQFADGGGTLKSNIFHGIVIHVDGYTSKGKLLWKISGCKIWLQAMLVIV